MSTWSFAILFALYYLTEEWLPLGAQNHFALNFIFIVLIVGIVLTLLSLMVHYYEPVLRWCLSHKVKFLAIPVITLLFGIVIWLGVDRIFGFAADGIEKTGWHIRQSSGWQRRLRFSWYRQGIYALTQRRFIFTDAYQYASCRSGTQYRVRKATRPAIGIYPEVEISVGKWGASTLLSIRQTLRCLRM